MRLQKNDIIFHNWKVKRIIGEGSFGTVYEIEREEFGRIYRAAAKVIPIPDDVNEISHLIKEGMTEENVIDYCRSMVENIVSECELMAKMRGDSHIVSYEDHYVEQSDSANQWMIYIRMELLKPVTDCITAEDTLKEEEVIRLGIDICKALEICQQFNVIHRDVKLENIFVSDTGHYKLGDFGISKIMEKSEKAVSQKGTRLYMAPEIFRGEKYDATVDIYSLGLVLFRLMNHNRAPFLPPYPETICIQDKENALTRRMEGEEIPDPCNGDKYLSTVIRKACSFRPAQRYQTPGEMRERLEALLKEQNKQILVFENTKTEELSETLCIRKETGICSLYGNEKQNWKRSQIPSKQPPNGHESTSPRLVSHENKRMWKAAFILVVTVAVVAIVILRVGIVQKETADLSSRQITGSITNKTETEGFRDIPSETEEKTELEKTTEMQSITVPKVTGLTEAEAVKRLIEAGYNEENIQITYEYNNMVESGLVIAQSVSEEMQVDKDSTILLDISLGKQPVAVTTQSQTKEEESEWIWKSLD